jgi:hypothetical protein
MLALRGCSFAGLSLLRKHNDQVPRLGRSVLGRASVQGVGCLRRGLPPLHTGHLASPRPEKSQYVTDSALCDIEAHQGSPRSRASGLQQTLSVRTLAKAQGGQSQAMY